MKKNNIIQELYNEIKDSNDVTDSFNWDLILEILKKEKEKDPRNEYVTLKSAIRIFLGASNNYDNVFFTKICEVQEELEAYYDGLLKNFISINSSLSEKRIKKMIKNLKIHYDLYAEIIDYLLAGNVYERTLISEQGYDVKRLCKDYKLSIVGAYNYLIYLRQKPKEALAKLKKGLPRK